MVVQVWFPPTGGWGQLLGTLTSGPWDWCRFIGQQGQRVLGLVLAHWYAKPGYKVPEYRALGFLEWMLACWLMDSDSYVSGWGFPELVLAHWWVGSRGFQRWCQRAGGCAGFWHSWLWGYDGLEACVHSLDYSTTGTQISKLLWVVFLDIRG